MIRWEIWIRDTTHPWRFNACFETRDKAEQEATWYKTWGYETDVRIRTTRYQRPEHRTTGPR